MAQRTIYWQMRKGRQARFSVNGLCGKSLKALYTTRHINKQPNIVLTTGHQRYCISIIYGEMPEMSPPDIERSIVSGEMACGLPVY